MTSLEEARQAAAEARQAQEQVRKLEDARAAAAQAAAADAEVRRLDTLRQQARELPRLQRIADANTEFERANRDFDKSLDDVASLLERAAGAVEAVRPRMEKISTLLREIQPHADQCQHDLEAAWGRLMNASATLELARWRASLAADTGPHADARARSGGLVDMDSRNRALEAWQSLGGQSENLKLLTQSQKRVLMDAFPPLAYQKDVTAK